MFARKRCKNAGFMTLKKMGIDKALREAGARYGDHVIVGKYDMTWEE